MPRYFISSLDSTVTLFFSIAFRLQTSRTYRIYVVERIGWNGKLKDSVVAFLSNDVRYLFRIIFVWRLPFSLYNNWFKFIYRIFCGISYFSFIFISYHGSSVLIILILIHSVHFCFWWLVTHFAIAFLFSTRFHFTFEFPSTIVPFIVCSLVCRWHAPPFLHTKCFHFIFWCSYSFNMMSYLHPIHINLRISFTFCFISIVSSRLD